MLSSLCFYLFVLFIWYHFDADSYVTGITKYIKNNNLPSIPLEKRELCWDSVVNESHELLEALQQLSTTDIMLEGSDVIHAIIKYLIIKYLPPYVYCQKYIWYFVFLIALPATSKLATRRREFNCIRNHANPNNCQHICDYKK